MAVKHTSHLFRVPASHFSKISRGNLSVHKLLSVHVSPHRESVNSPLHHFSIFSGLYLLDNFFIASSDTERKCPFSLLAIVSLNSYSLAMNNRG